MDGKRLAFITRPAGGRYGLVTLSAEGGDISADLLASASPEEMTYKAVWMPSGDRILAVRSTRSSTNEMPFALWDVPLTGAAPRRLGLLPVPNFRGGYGVSGMRVQPDGKRLEFQFHEGLVEQTWAIDNLFQFIKAGGGR
jgi:hypothetical protein